MHVNIHEIFLWDRGVPGKHQNITQEHIKRIQLKDSFQNKKKSMKGTASTL